VQSIERGKGLKEKGGGPNIDEEFSGKRLKSRIRRAKEEKGG